MNETPPPGWYPDARTPDLERWWDGREWSSVTRSAGGQVTAPGPERSPVGDRSHPLDRRPYDHGSEGPGKPLPYTPDGVRLASWGRRAAARVLDGLVVWTVAAFVARGQVETIQQLIQERTTSQAGATRGNSGLFELMENPNYATAALQLTLIFLLASAVYEIPFLAMRGGTPAKLLLGLRVRRWETTGPPSWPAAVGRWFVGQGVPLIGSLVGFAFWAVDNLFPLWDERRQAVHDKAARTVVVRVS